MFRLSGISRIFWLLTLAAFTVAILLWGLVVAYRQGRSGIEEQFARDQLKQTRLLASQFENRISSLQHSLNRLVMALDDVDQEHLRADLKLLASSQPGSLLTALFVRDNEGNILATSDPQGLVDGSLPIHLLNIPTRRESGGKLIWTPQPSILLSQRPPAGTNLELIALVSLQALVDDLTADPEVRQEVLLMDTTGQVLLHPSQALQGLSYHELIDATPTAELQSVYTAMVRGDEAVANLAAEEWGQTDVLLSYTPFNLGGGTWSVGRVAPSFGLSTLDRAQQLTAVLVVCAIGGTFLLVLFLLASWRRADGLDELVSRQRQQLGELDSITAEATRRSRQLLEFASDAMFFINPESGKIIEQNQVTCDLIGYSAAEIKTLTLDNLFPGHQKRRYQRLVQKVMKHGYGEAGDLTFRRKDGSLFTGAIHARLGTLGQERVVHGSLRDISPLKQIETELRRKNRDLALLNRIAHRAAASHDRQELLNGILETVVEALDADSGGVFIVRHAGNDLHFAARYNVPDEVYAELSELQPGQGLIGLVAQSGQPRSAVDLRKDSRRWSQTVVAAEWRGFQAVPLAAGEKIVGVLFISCKTKKVFNRDHVRLLLAIGKQVGTTIEGSELLEALRWQNRLTQASNRELKVSRQRLKENLRRQQEATRTLERLELMKNNFLALASHELRTPLTYILSGTELLLDAQSELQPNHEQILSAVRQGGVRLQEIVDNLLEVARLEAQSIYLGRERLELKSLFADLEKSLSDQISQQQIDFSIRPPEQKIELFGDPDHLARALRRVVENAVKFTPPGGSIRIESKRISGKALVDMKPELAPFTISFFTHPPADDYLQLTVSDSGIGIDQEEQTRIFDKFYEVGDITDHHTSPIGFGGKGVGLGLTLVRGMLEAHGGMVWVSSEGTGDGGRGSQFHLVLPVGTVDSDAGNNAILA